MTDAPKQSVAQTVAKRRELPFGSLYRRRDTGGWYLHIRLPGQKKATAMPMVPVGALRATTARQVALACARRVISGLDAQQEPPAVETLLEAFTRFVGGDTSARNAKDETHAVKVFLKTSATTPSRIDVQAVRRYFQRLQELKRAPATIGRHRAAISRFCQFLIEQGILDDNPALEVKPPRIYHPPPRFLSAEQIEQLVAKAKNQSTDLHGPILACLCGLRLSEMIRLTGGSVRSGNLIVGLDKATKTFLWRSVPMSPAMVEWLKDHPADDKAHLFPQLPPQEYVKVMREFTAGMAVFGELPGKRAGNRWHLLRSTFAVCNAGAGATLWQLMAWLGHTNPTTTMRYVNIAQASGLTGQALSRWIGGLIERKTT